MIILDSWVVWRADGVRVQLHQLKKKLYVKITIHFSAFLISLWNKTWPSLMVMSVLYWIPQKAGLKTKAYMLLIYKRSSVQGKQNVGELIGVCVTEPATAWYLSLVGPSSKRPYGWLSLRTLSLRAGCGKNVSPSNLLSLPPTSTPHHMNFRIINTNVTGSSTSRDALRQEAHTVLTWHPVGMNLPKASWSA